MVNPLRLDTPGPSGPIRDLVRRVDELGRRLAEVRSTALTRQDLPTPVAPVEPAWGMRAVRLSGTTTVPTATWVLLSWPTVAMTAGTAVVSPAGNTADLRAEVAGIYHVAAHVHFVTGGAEAPREMRIMRNSTPLDTASRRTATAVTLSLGRPVRLAAGDLLAVEVRQESGGALGVYNVESFGSFALALIHAE